MDRERFDAVARVLATTGSRRTALVALLGAGLLGHGLDAVARKGKDRSKRRGNKGKSSRGDRGRSLRAEQVPSRCFTGSPCTPGPGKNLGKCNLGGSSALQNKNLKGANLGQANLANANASGANFSSANLGGACLVEANLTNAIINNSTNFSTAVICRTTLPDGTIGNTGCNLGTECCPTCDAENLCPAGELCCRGRCRSVECCGTGQQSTCLPGQTCCGNECVDLATDPGNCGTCGNACDQGVECVGGVCESPLILSGGPDPATPIEVDDDLTVFLNGAIIFNDSDGLASTVGPLVFAAQPGDNLRVVATNVVAPCMELSPLHLHRTTGGATQVLDPVGVPNACPDDPVGVFYDEAFTITA